MTHIGKNNMKILSQSQNLHSILVFELLQPELLQFGGASPDVDQADLKTRSSYTGPSFKCLKSEYSGRDDRF